MLSLVKTHCCWGSGVVSQMSITGMDYVPAYHYEIQTFAEKRETNWVCGPHKGLDMDSATSGRAPLPWAMDLPPSNMFKEEVRVVTVPHTGVVKACHRCRGTGGMSCRDCSGKVSNNIIIIVIITFIINIIMLGLLRQGNHRHSLERSPSARTNVNFGAILS